MKWFLVFLMIFFATPSSAVELSGGTTIPSGGVINSLYLSGSPASGLTIKVRTESDFEYTAFLGGLVLVSFEQLFFLNDRVYSILGGSVPLALNVGGGMYLVRGSSFGVRLQYTSLITGGGSVLGSGVGGPFPISWLGLLVSWSF